MNEVKGSVGRVETTCDNLQKAMADLQIMVARIDAQIPYLATKADLAEKPGKTYTWGIMAASLTAYAWGLAAIAILK